MSSDARFAAVAAQVSGWWTTARRAPRGGPRDGLSGLARLPLRGPSPHSGPDLAAAFGNSAFRALVRAAAPAAGQFAAWGPLLATAGVALAQVTADSPVSLGACLRGRRNAWEAPDLAESRFARLMRQTDSAGLFFEVRRIAPFWRGPAPVGELGASLILWFEDPLRRLTIAKDYYGPARDDPKVAA